MQHFNRDNIKHSRYDTNAVLYVGMLVKKTQKQGHWSASGEAFENTLTLEKINEKENIYQFSFDGWRKSYDTFTKQIIRFPGSMSEERFVVQIIDNYGYYTDDILVEVDELPLYKEKSVVKCFLSLTKKP